MLPLELLARGAFDQLDDLELRTAKNELRTKVEAMRKRLMEALTGQFDHELAHSLSRIREAVSPYTRFVRAERERLTELRQELRRIRVGLERIRIELR